MIVSREELIPILRSFNPWWGNNGQTLRLPPLKRAIFGTMMTWLLKPPTSRALQILGLRQIGKTTLLRQAAQELITKGVPAQHILYATFDHPLLRLAGLGETLKAWHEQIPGDDQPRYLLLDEVQALPDWATHIKHLIDFQPQYRIVLTGSAIPLSKDSAESGVGRLTKLPLSTLSFYEYMQLRHPDAIQLPSINNLQEVGSLSPADKIECIDTGEKLTSYFHEYLLQGGFPESTQIEDIDSAQRLLREDIVDRVLKRDMTALFGVRHVAELEQLFLYLCLHDGGLFNATNVAKELEMKRPTVNSFLELLEAAHLISRLKTFGYGTKVLRAKPKIYMADPGLAPAVLLKSRAMLEDENALGLAVETAAYKHLTTHLRTGICQFTYWQNKKKQEVDLIAQLGGGRIVPFEVKYRNKSGWENLAGLSDFLSQNEEIEHAYVFTKRAEHIGILPSSQIKTQVIQVPAALGCYILGRSEHMQVIGA